MTQTELNLTANYIATLASQPDSKERIALFLDGLLSSLTQKNEPVREEKPSVSAKIRFSQKELTHMSKTFKKEFIANGLAAHVIKRQRSKNCTIYIIRYRRNGYNICVSANSMEEARARFLQATKAENIEKYRRKNYARGSFAAIAREWLEFKEGKLNPRTHKNYESYCRRYLLPALGDLPVSSIKTIDLNKIMSGVEGRVYEDLRIVLNSVFKYAMASGIISHNPVTLIPLQENGTQQPPRSDSRRDPRTARTARTPRVSSL